MPRPAGPQCFGFDSSTGLLYTLSNIYFSKTNTSFGVTRMNVSSIWDPNSTVSYILDPRYNNFTGEQCIFFPPNSVGLKTKKAGFILPAVAADLSPGCEILANYEVFEAETGNHVQTVLF
jgi:hypothetical protein